MKMKKVKVKPKAAPRAALPAMVKWLALANDAQRKQLAKLAGTKVNHLYQLAGGHRKASASLAIALERASLKVELARPKGEKKLVVPPPLYREQLALSSCGICEFAAACRSKAKKSA